MITTIFTEKAPAPVGPYSQACVAGDMLFISGIIGTNPKTGKLAGEGVKIQAKQSILNIGEILKQAGCAYSDVIKTTCFLSKMEDFKDFNDVYAQYFTTKPARSCVAVKELPQNALCEIEVVVYLGDEERRGVIA